mmetsp:Transcript_13793/g.45365  ORF Transcript_13793/g.45365 Transcript_13793/m.45365 type:complete len:340 (+) Transcript_13793:123-1142(+)
MTLASASLYASLVVRWRTAAALFHHSCSARTCLSCSAAKSSKRLHATPAPALPSVSEVAGAARGSCSAVCCASPSSLAAADSAPTTARTRRAEDASSVSSFAVVDCESTTPDSTTASRMRSTASRWSSRACGESPCPATDACTASMRLCRLRSLPSIAEAFCSSTATSSTHAASGAGSAIPEPWHRIRASISFSCETISACCPSLVSAPSTLSASSPSGPRYWKMGLFSMSNFVLERRRPNSSEHCSLIRFEEGKEESIRCRAGIASFPSSAPYIKDLSRLTPSDDIATDCSSPCMLPSAILFTSACNASLPLCHFCQGCELCENMFKVGIPSSSAPES